MPDQVGPTVRLKKEPNNLRLLKFTLPLQPQSSFDLFDLGAPG